MFINASVHPIYISTCFFSKALLSHILWGSEYGKGSLQNCLTFWQGYTRIQKMKTFAEWYNTFAPIQWFDDVAIQCINVIVTAINKTMS